MPGGLSLQGHCIRNIQKCKKNFHSKCPYRADTARKQKYAPGMGSYVGCGLLDAPAKGACRGSRPRRIRTRCEEGPDSPERCGLRNILTPVRPGGRTPTPRGQTGATVHPLRACSRLAGSRPNRHRGPQLGGSQILFFRFFEIKQRKPGGPNEGQQGQCAICTKTERLFYLFCQLKNMKYFV